MGTRWRLGRVALLCAVACGDSTGPPIDPDGSVPVADAPPGTPDADVLVDGGLVITASGVAQGPCHGCAWHGGRAFCWGANGFGQLGDGSIGGEPAARPVADLTTVTQVAVGCGDPGISGHSCALLAGGEVWCWGSNGNDQLGDESGEDQARPVRVGNLPVVVGISVGAYHSCALGQNQRVYCWGRNDSLQIGDGSGMQRPRATQAFGVLDAVEVSAGYFHTCARRQGGTLMCWGPNAYGEAGTGDLEGVFFPEPVQNISGAVQVAAGSFHTCARLGDGTVWCWGNGEFGSLGNDTTVQKQTTPVQVMLDFDAVEVSSVTAHCAREAQGTVACWGPRVAENLSLVVRDVPEPVSMLDDAAGLGGSCAARPGGLVSCWGLNGSGQIGDGTKQDRFPATGVVGLTW